MRPEEEAEDEEGAEDDEAGAAAAAAVEAIGADVDGRCESSRRLLSLRSLLLDRDRLLRLSRSFSGDALRFRR